MESGVIVRAYEEFAFYFDFNFKNWNDIYFFKYINDEKEEGNEIILEEILFFFQER